MNFFCDVFKDKRPGFRSVMGTQILVKAAVTIVPFIDNIPCWWWLHHLTPSVERKSLQNILRRFTWLVALLQKRKIHAECFSPSLFPVLRNGYEAASKDFDPQDLDVSVVGRSFMITGANSGIGRATAIAVAKQGRSQVGSGCNC